MTTAVVLLNRLPNKSISGRTPYYSMFGKHADLSFCELLGPVASYITKGSYFHKLDPRLREGVLIGLYNGKPTFRICFRKMGQVERTRNVAFIEVPSAAVSTATGTGGQHDDDKLVNENLKLNVDSTESNLDIFNNPVAKVSWGRNSNL